MALLSFVYFEFVLVLVLGLTAVNHIIIYSMSATFDLYLVSIGMPGKYNVTLCDNWYECYYFECKGYSDAFKFSNDCGMSKDDLLRRAGDDYSDVGSKLDTLSAFALVYSTFVVLVLLLFFIARLASFKSRTMNVLSVCILIVTELAMRFGCYTIHVNLINRAPYVPNFITDNQHIRDIGTMVCEAACTVLIIGTLVTSLITSKDIDMSEILTFTPESERLQRATSNASDD